MKVVLVRVPLVAAVASVMVLLIAVPLAPGATIAVAPSAVDVVANGQCSLVEAINNANADAAASADCGPGSGADTIVLADASTYSVSQVDNTFFGFTGLPVITSEITVDGNGATIARDGSAAAFRLLVVSVNGKLTVKDAVLSNGLAHGGNGGNDTGTDDGGGGGGGAGLGGAIYNRGVVSLTRATLSANIARGGDGGAGGDNINFVGDAGGGAGGGGLGGDGGSSSPAASFDGGNGGGGWGGQGGPGGLFAGGGGGGTTGNGAAGGGTLHGPGGIDNGGDGGDDGFDGSPGGLGGGGGGAGNERSGGAGGLGGGGGGSHNQGLVITTGSGGFGGGDGGPTGTESAGGGGGAGMGGAIFNDGGAIIVLNSTFSGNSAEGGAGGAGTPGTGQDGQGGRGLGGGIFSLSGNVTVTESTFSGNNGEGGGIYVRQGAQGARLALRNSIVANGGGTAPDCVLDGAVDTAGSVTNLVERNTGCAGINVTEDPRLGPLGDNGGLTPTFLPAIGSPAVNAASKEACTKTDQRDKPRPVGKSCDEGSVETAPRVSRKVGIKYKGGAFTGKLKSKVAACVTGKVTIFRSQRGTDPKVAKDKVNRAGKYVAKESDPDPGKYYAKAKQVRANEITCLAAKSKTKSVG